MTDPLDQAAMFEELHRQSALDRHRQNSQTAAVSAYECEECGETIPEARRLAVIGCRCCINCQQELEQYGKTRITAPRN